MVAAAGVVDSNTSCGCFLRSLAAASALVPAPAAAVEDEHVAASLDVEGRGDARGAVELGLTLEAQDYTAAVE